MSTIKELYVQSLLAQASYANLTAGSLNTNAQLTNLESEKQGSMAAAEATNFASKWTVVDQYNGLSGVSATVFHNIAENKNYLVL